MKEKAMQARSMLSLAIVVSLLGACAKPPPQVLGTLEWDRITLPAPVAEKIPALRGWAPAAAWPRLAAV